VHLIAQGALQAIHVGRRLRITEAQLQAFVAQQQAPQIDKGMTP
jgi:excisionase family DNA binding protein